MTRRNAICHAAPAVVSAAVVAAAAAACGGPQAAPTATDTADAVNALHIAQIGHGQRAAFVHCPADRCPMATTKTLAPAPAATPTSTAATRTAFKPERPAQRARILTVQFAFASARVDAKALQVLREAEPLLLGAREIILSGHTDTSGPIAVNLRLAAARAEAVRVALQTIAPSAAAKALIDMPDDCCAGETGQAPGQRARHRRVDIRLVLGDNAN